MNKKNTDIDYFEKQLNTKEPKLVPFSYRPSITTQENTVNTQEIQEWEEDLETLLDHAVPQVVFEGVESLKKDVKSFISQKLKEQEERHKREIETILSKVEYDRDFGLRNNQAVSITAEPYVVWLLSKYE
jgi:hypothetical protein